MSNLDFKSQTAEFNEIWSKRYQDPVITENWIETDWAKGRTEYLTFLIRVNNNDVVEKILEIQEELINYSCVDVAPERYLHITVKETGCFLVNEKKDIDELERCELENLVNQVGNLLQNFNPFKVRLSKLNNFKSAVVLEGHDGGVIRGINRALLNVNRIRKLYHDPFFLPHVSIALYKSSNQYKDLLKLLEEKRETHLPSLWVESIELVIAHLPKHERFPKLESVKEFKLQ